MKIYSEQRKYPAGLDMESKRIRDRISLRVISLLTATHAISKCLVIIIVKACLMKSVTYFQRFWFRWYNSTYMSVGFGFNPRGRQLP